MPSVREQLPVKGKSGTDGSAVSKKFGVIRRSENWRNLMKHLPAAKHFNLHINGGILGVTGRLASHFSIICLITRLSVWVRDLGVAASVVECKRGLHGLRIGTGLV